MYQELKQGCDPELIRDCRAAYCGMVETLDGYVGQLYERFRSMEGESPHLFCYTSDHGEQMGRRQIFGKQTLYEEALRVPLYWAGDQIPAGKTYHQAVSLLDVSRTILEAAGAANPVIDETIVARIHEGVDASEIEHFVNEEHAEPLVYGGKTIGFVKRAHDVDENLSAHTMLENMVSKASAVLSLLHLIRVTGIDKNEIDYVIDCCEEACGDMNQRGGGNFAKAAAEIAGLNNATGCDVRGFCAGPTHAFINAASLVKAGTHKHVVVVAGGCTAKLGMNGKDHVKKGLPILEDMIGGFAILLGENDGINPEVDTEHTGKHTVGTGSAPQNVISSLVTNPLDAAGLKITDVDKYSAEMQNPDQGPVL